MSDMCPNNTQFITIINYRILIYSYIIGESILKIKIITKNVAWGLLIITFINYKQFRFVSKRDKEWHTAPCCGTLV